MKSMTGYGCCELENEKTRVESEIRSVNGRNLKISAKLTPGLMPHELEIRKLVAKRIKRGSVYITISSLNESRSTSCIVETLLRSYHKRLSELSKELDLAPPTLDALLALPGVVDPGIEGKICDEDWEMVQKALDHSLTSLEKMREREGALLEKEILQYREELQELYLNLEKRAPEVAGNYHNRLKNRLQELSGKEFFQYTEDDILREAAIFSDRADISEEVTRIKSHLLQFSQIIEQEQAVGKTLEFILQEIIRESNTVASKANDVESSQIVVRIKAIVEKIREQIQNVE